MDKATQSKERISLALLDLIETMAYGDITIQTLVDHADVSRMAFYRNFESKDHVMRYYLRKRTDEFIVRSQIEADQGFGPGYFRKLVTYLSEERHLGMLLIKADLFDMIRAEFERVYASKAKNTQEKLLSYFIAGGICNVYHYWLCSGCKESPEQLADALERVLNRLRS